jgi:hypothetical protein
MPEVADEQPAKLGGGGLQLLVTADDRGVKLRAWWR